ncbi:hypothetical protein [Rickettsiales endosymbiont of Stachyamoeba lipophora]|uniref:hypothetical protein n=1 Tax=Rickettsiales endosymbiont of Stachyamoeba lipophora TaxID=2486578 RepID=UPI000F645A17|nr:hypothetical protein [Rickettsiales endosymbiont of Stachyamoeba lipophora]AZL15772.1 hypothetical protein EF513_04330 [Rickettsiales endosymbiont of Stachyamoeba lipophora]
MPKQTTRIVTSPQKFHPDYVKEDFRCLTDYLDRLSRTTLIKRAIISSNLLEVQHSFTVHFCDEFNYLLEEFYEMEDLNTVNEQDFDNELYEDVANIKFYIKFICNVGILFDNKWCFNLSYFQQISNDDLKSQVMSEVVNYLVGCSNDVELAKITLQMSSHQFIQEKKLNLNNLAQYLMDQADNLPAYGPFHGVVNTVILSKICRCFYIEENFQYLNQVEKLVLIGPNQNFAQFITDLPSFGLDRLDGIVNQIEHRIQQNNIPPHATNLVTDPPRRSTAGFYR